MMKPRNALLFALMLLVCAPLAAGGARAIEGQNDLIEQAKDPVRSEAARLIKAGKYASALPLLQKAAAKDPRNANIQNSLGHTLRELKRYDDAMKHYLIALEIQPKHRGANEYLGELYLELGRLADAEDRLKVLRAACLFSCEERRDLEKAIAAYKAKNAKTN